LALRQAIPLYRGRACAHHLPHSGEGVDKATAAAGLAGEGEVLFILGIAFLGGWLLFRLMAMVMFRGKGNFWSRVIMGGCVTVILGASGAFVIVVGNEEMDDPSGYW